MAKFKIDSEFIGVARAPSRFQANLACEIARVNYLTVLEGLNALDVSDGDEIRVTAKAQVTKTHGLEEVVVNELILQPTSKGRITNAKQVAGTIGKREFVEIEYSDAGIVFTKTIGVHDVRIKIIPEGIAKNLDVVRAALARMDITRKLAQEIEKPEPASLPDIERMNNVRAALGIIEYTMLGERRAYEAGKYSKVQRTDSYLADALRATIKSIDTTVGDGPLVTYSEYPDRARKIEVMPSQGRRIVRFALTSEAHICDEQKPGMVKYTYGPNEFVIHRRHIHDKFDFRGTMLTDRKEYATRSPTAEEYQKAMGILYALPIGIRTNDDTELTVVDAGRMMIILPKSGSEIQVKGYERAIAEGRIHELPRSNPRRRNFRTKELGQEGYEFGVFADAGQLFVNLETTGGTEKDVFDIFYVQHQKEKQKK